MTSKILNPSRQIFCVKDGVNTRDTAYGRAGGMVRVRILPSLLPAEFVLGSENADSYPMSSRSASIRLASARTVRQSINSVAYRTIKNSTFGQVTASSWAGRRW